MKHLWKLTCYQNIALLDKIFLQKTYLGKETGRGRETELQQATKVFWSHCNTELDVLSHYIHSSSWGGHNQQGAKSKYIFSPCYK